MLTVRRIVALTVPTILVYCTVMYRVLRDDEHPGPVTVTTTVSKPNANFLHIPKCAGVSFYREMKDKINFSDYSPGNNEVCMHYMKKTKVNDYKYVTFVRNPLNHILSQYIMCRYSPWGKQETGKIFWKRFREDDFEIDNYDGFHDWLTHFTTSTDSHRCYYPYNLQTRALTCEREKAHYHINNFDYGADRAVGVLETLDGTFGVVEYYAESLCLIMDTLSMEFPRWCQCNYRHEYKMLHYDHNMPKHSVKRVSPKTVDLAMSFIRHDMELYTRATVIFIKRIHELERKRGIEILC